MTTEAADSRESEAERDSTASADGSAGELLSRKEQKKATRIALRSAALECFEEVGYAGTQIGHITERAGVAKGTFYVHFSDKDELLDEVLADFNDGFVARLSGIWSDSSLRRPRLLIRRVAETFLDYWSEHRGFIRAYSEKSAGGVGLHALQFGLNPQMQQLLAGAITRVAAERGAEVTNLDLVIQAILSMWLRLGLQSLFNASVQRADVIDTLVKMTTGALTAVIPGLDADDGGKE